MLNDFAKIYLSILTGKDQSIHRATLKSYLDQVPDEDKRMAITLLNGYKSLVQVKRTDLTPWLIEFKSLPEWLIKETHTVTGDWAETYSLVLGNPNILYSGLSLSEFVKQLQQPRSTKNELRAWVESMWAILSPDELLLFHKLILGQFKTVKEKNFLAFFIATQYQIDYRLVVLRLFKNSAHWNSFHSLIHPEWSPDESPAMPYIFNQPILYDPEHQVLKPAGTHWYSEPFIAGQRIQLIKRNEETYVWSSDSMLLTPIPVLLQKFTKFLPAGVVLDGIIQLIKTDEVTENPGTKIKKEDPIQFVMLDVLEWKFEDVRNRPLDFRKQLVETITREINHPGFIPVLYQENDDPDLIKTDQYPEGWILKRKDSRYDPDHNTWWRIKSPNKQIHAVLMYVETLPRQNQVYLCTFGIYNEEQTLVPIVKLPSDQLGEAQVTQLHYWVQNNVIQKFGPVRVVRPQQVFLIVYDKPVINVRLKAGITLKNAQIKKWENKPGTGDKIGSMAALKKQN